MYKTVLSLFLKKEFYLSFTGDFEKLRESYFKLVV